MYAARGDYRRAAYIHGVQLRDLRSAANALLAGGLYRDAAVLLRDRIRDEAAAARAFEQAGDYDEAVRLYEKQGQYEQAVDLLRRIGDEDRAAHYFLRAALLLVDRGRHLASGDLVRGKLGDVTLADHYYRLGWEKDGPGALPCAERLLDQFLVAEAWSDVKRLADEAEERFAPPRGRDAGRFFNYLLREGNDLLPADLRDDLADRARLLFADHLRPVAGSPQVADKVAGELFGQGAPWPGPVVRDAAYAVRGLVRNRPLRSTSRRSGWPKGR
jgi:tetratricopeptide (TPR) repeat protein